ncbi:MAG: hypothetical protein H7831_01205 [Magnetococcus sp. WYHC-3]
MNPFIDTHKVAPLSILAALPLPGRFWILGLALLLVLLPAPPARADAENDHDLALTLVRSGQILALIDLVSRHPALESARLLEVELETRENRYIYEIEFLDPRGHVQEWHLDAAHGTLLQQQEEGEED